MFVTRARDNSCFVAFCNTVGGQDELIFDGHSCVLDDEGNVLARAPGFEEALLFADIEPQEVIGRRLSDVRRRALARERETGPAGRDHPRRLARPFAATGARPPAKSPRSWTRSSRCDARSSSGSATT